MRGGVRDATTASRRAHPCAALYGMVDRPWCPKHLGQRAWGQQAWRSRMAQGASGWCLAKFRGITAAVEVWHVVNGAMRLLPQVAV